MKKLIKWLDERDLLGEVMAIVFLWLPFIFVVLGGVRLFVK